MQHVDPLKNIHRLLEELLALQGEAYSLSIGAKIISKVKILQQSYASLDVDGRSKIDKLLKECQQEELLTYLKENKSGSGLARKSGSKQLDGSKLRDKLTLLKEQTTEKTDSVLAAKPRSRSASVDDSNKFNSLKDESNETSSELDTDEFAWLLDAGTVKKVEGDPAKDAQMGMAVSRATAHRDNTSYIANSIVAPQERGVSMDPLLSVIEALEALKRAKKNKDKEKRRGHGSVTDAFESAYRAALSTQVMILGLHRMVLNDVNMVVPQNCAKLTKIQEELGRAGNREIDTIAKAESIAAVVNDSLIDELKACQQVKQRNSLRKSK